MRIDKPFIQQGNITGSFQGPLNGNVVGNLTGTASFASGFNINDALDKEDFLLYNNSFYVNDGVKDIQTAVTEIGAGQGDVIYIGPGAYGGADVEITGSSNMLLHAVGASAGSGATITELAGTRGITIGGATTTRIRVNNLQLGGTLNIQGTQGRHRFYNCIIPTASIGLGTQNFIIFDKCEIGDLTIDNTFAGLVYLLNSNFTGTITNNAPFGALQVIIANSTGLQNNFKQVGTTLGFNSTASPFQTYIDGTHFSGSFSGSFQGDGKELTNVTASALGGELLGNFATLGSNTFTGQQTLLTSSVLIGTPVNQFSTFSGSLGNNLVLGTYSFFTGSNNLIKGTSTTTIGSGNTLVGNSSGVRGTNSVVIGNTSNTYNNTENNVLLGNNVSSFTSNNVILGRDITYSGAGSSIILGYNAANSATGNTTVIGTGKGPTGTTAHNVAIFRRIGSNPTMKIDGHLFTTGSVQNTGSVSISGSLTLTDILQANYLASANYTSDANAAAGGIPINGIYRNGNDLKVRLT